MEIFSESKAKNVLIGQLSSRSSADDVRIKEYHENLCQ